MIDDKDFSGRKLTDVFKELEQARYDYEQENFIAENSRKQKENFFSRIHNKSKYGFKNVAAEISML